MPETSAGRRLLLRNPGLPADDVLAVEVEARSGGLALGSERFDRVVERLRPLLSPDQLAALRAARLLDPDAIAGQTDAVIRVVLAGLADPRDQAPMDPATREAAERYLREIR
jgi:hypothetical protein